MSDHQDTRAAWDKIAPGYDRTNTASQMWLANEGLRRAGLQRGQTFLDVCSGSGAVAIPAARLGAQVTAIDQSSSMLEHLNARAKKENKQHLDWELLEPFRQAYHHRLNYKQQQMLLAQVIQFVTKYRADTTE